MMYPKQPIPEGFDPSKPFIVREVGHIKPVFVWEAHDATNFKELVAMTYGNKESWNEFLGDRALSDVDWRDVLDYLAADQQYVYVYNVDDVAAQTRKCAQVHKFLESVPAHRTDVDEALRGVEVIVGRSWALDFRDKYNLPAERLTVEEWTLVSPDTDEGCEQVPEQLITITYPIGDEIVDFAKMEDL